MQTFQIVSTPLVWIAEMLIFLVIFTQYKKNKLNLIIGSVILTILIVITVISAVAYFREFIPFISERIVSKI